jgi:chemotaxis protein MotA
LDIASVIGLLLGLAAVVGGAALEGLHLASITQPTAAIIVLGGTIGATLLSFPTKTVVGAAKSISKVLFEEHSDQLTLIEEIIGYADKARKEGLIALESCIPDASDDFLKRAMSLVVDGVEPQVLRETMEIELAHMEETSSMEAKVFEGAGGYAPTIGIIGAVLGLIHVMNNLADPSKLGSGIAVAFVATVYGVGSANLLFLPMASKLKARLKHSMVAKEMMLEGVIGMLEGSNPMLIEERLKGYLTKEMKLERQGRAKKGQAADGAAESRPARSASKA